MRTVTLANGEKIPQLGLGTWKMGERRSDRAAEVKALQLGLDLGLALIDTAEMYGEGGAEEVIAEAATSARAGRRDQLYLVSKVYPHNASRAGAITACERSLQRLETDRLDLYLLHWRGSHPLAETVAAFEQLKRDGKIRQWGVSNFDADGMAELARLPDGGKCLMNQVLYHPGNRGIEWDLIPAAAKPGGAAIMAYSPLGQGGILADKTLATIGARLGVAPATVALAWVMRHPNVVAIPKATKLEHVRQNAAAQDLVLDAADLAALDRAFPAPKRRQPLAIL